VGVRPDGFTVTDPAAASLRGRVVLNEYLGRESYLHLDLEQGGAAVVEVSPDLDLRAGGSVGLAVKPGAAHLFGAADQQRIAA
jgi:ABC-type sugar transport system ATPase subunit